MGILLFDSPYIFFRQYACYTGEEGEGLDALQDLKVQFSRLLPCQWVKLLMLDIEVAPSSRVAHKAEDSVEVNGSSLIPLATMGAWFALLSFEIDEDGAQKGLREGQPYHKSVESASFLS